MSGGVATTADIGALTDGADETTFDAFLGGRFTLAQPRRGFRCGSDALLLAAAAPVAAASIVDLGCGPGAVGFAAACACPAALVLLVDREPLALALCRESLRHQANRGIVSRIALARGDVGETLERWDPPPAANGADLVLANPPFFDPARSRRSHDAARDRARRSDAAGVEPWVRSAERLLRAGGVLALISPGERLAEVLAAMTPRFGDLKVYPIRASKEAAATRVIVAGRKGSRAPLALAAGLVTHDGSRYSDAAEAVLRDAARLPGLGL